MKPNILPNGTLVTISSAYPCKGQVCGNVDNFIGLFYDIVILETSLFEVGEIHRVSADYVWVTEILPHNTGTGRQLEDL